MYFVSAFGEYIGPFKTANEAAKWIKDSKAECCPSIKPLVDPARMLAKRSRTQNKSRDAA